ncbi:MAG: hypothetical protein LBB18_01585 [Puniceicoccales bacterium]|jgi:hypothetical protein|nr:hypothetical protein [Puniceicoccales bacterium]
MPEFEEGFVEGVGGVVLDETTEVSNRDGEEIAKTQARYSLKRGRLPHAHGGTAPVDNSVAPANVVDVTRDAIGSRVDGGKVPRQQPVRQSSVKKSTEIIDNNRTKRPQGGRDHGDHMKNGRVNSKDGTRDRVEREEVAPSIGECACVCKKSGGFRGLATKFLKFFTSKFGNICGGCKHGSESRIKSGRGDAAGKGGTIMAGRHHGRRSGSKKT